MRRSHRRTIIAMSLDGLDLVKLGEVRGWLRAYETLNTAVEQSDLSFDYSIEIVPWRGGLEDSLQAHFDARRSDEQSWHISIGEASPWRPSLEAVAERWFFWHRVLRERYDAARTGPRGLLQGRSR
jgi:hypothetical protein